MSEVHPVAPPAVPLPELTPLEARLAAMLAEVLDTPMITAPIGPNREDVGLCADAFQPDLAERAALLLEEIGL